MIVKSLAAGFCSRFSVDAAYAVGETIRHSAALIALLEIIHLIGLALLLGTILMVDLSLLGHGIGRHPVSRIARELSNWTMAGLAIMLVSGPLILSSEAVKCYSTPAFWIKMALLAIAVAFHFTVHRKVALAEPPSPRASARVVAGVSLALWFGVALAGKGIAIFQSLERKGVARTTNRPGTSSRRAPFARFLKGLHNRPNHAAIRPQRGAVGGRR